MNKVSFQQRTLTMSHNEAYDYKDDMALDSVWASCPADVLLEVFKQLDIQSLINCMDVNTYWRNLVEYYCEVSI